MTKMIKLKESNINKIRHSLSHILASVIVKKYPGTKLGIGPTISDGFYYDFDLPVSLKQEELPRIEKTMRKMISSNINFEKQIVSPEQAQKKCSGQPYKLELIKELINDKKAITFYRHGDFEDLCEGPHIENTKEIPLDSFKLTKVAGAYWRGSEKNPMLTRIYGVAFNTKKELEGYLKQQEELEKRDHRKLGAQLGIFIIVDEIGAGLPLWLPNGNIIKDELESWAKETEKAWGYQRVTTPHITKDRLYKISGHLPFYSDDMYSPLDIDGEKYYLKPMNCPHHHMIYKSSPKSYKELPLRLAEYGYLYRYELSGVLHGLMRVRGFCQNDAHIYLAEKDIISEFVEVMKMHKYYYKKLGIKNFKVKLGLRDPKNLRKKYHGDDAMWEKAEKLTREGLEKSNVEYSEDIGGAAHYGPKGDIIVESVIGTEYAIGTVQIDLFMGKRFGLEFTNEKGQKETPAIIHRAPLGSHERMIGFLLEHFAGAFPLWLSPVQVQIISVGKRHIKFCHKLGEELKENNIRVLVDDENETVGYKIHKAEKHKIPYMLVIGDKEAKGTKLTVRIRGKKKMVLMPKKKFLETILKEMANKK